MIRSLKKNGKGIAFMLASAICVCFGQLLWKLSVDGNVLALSFGFVLYGAGALLMILGYRFGKLSVLQPVLSINYGLSILLGYFILNECIMLNKIIAIVLIMCGITFVATGDKE